MKKLEVGNKTFNSLTEFLEFVHKKVKNFDYKFTDEDHKKGTINEKDVPGYMKHSSEQFIIMYAIECLMHVDSVINNITTSPSNAIYDYHVNTALNVLLDERERLLDILEESLGFIDGSKQMLVIRNGVLDAKKVFCSDRIYRKDTQIRKKTEKQATDSIREDFERLEELEKTMDEVITIICGASKYNPVAEAAKSELATVSQVYQPSTLLLAKSKKEELIEAEKRFLELDHLHSVADNAFAGFSYKRIKDSSKNTPEAEREVFREFKYCFKNIKRAGRHLKKYSDKIKKLQLQEEAGMSTDLRVAQRMLHLTPSVAYDVKDTGRILRDNEAKLLKSDPNLENELPGRHRHTIERIGEIKDLMGKGRSR